MSLKRKKTTEPEHLLPFLKTTKGRVSLITGTIGLILLIFFLTISSVTENILYRNGGIILALLIGVMPYVILDVRDNSRKGKIDENLPVFLLSLVSAVKSGSSLLDSIVGAAEREYGPLTAELKNFKVNISWGTPLDEAFKNFSQRLGTKLGARVVTLLETSIHQGGDIENTLDMVQQHITNLENLEKERIATLKPYTITIYIAYFIFIGIVILLIVSFFSELEIVKDELVKQTEEGARSLPLGMFQSMLGLDVDRIESILFHMGLIESVLCGIAAGKINSGTYIGGVKHVVIMMVFTLMAFSAIEFM